MRQRSFELIRKPELKSSSFLFNNVIVRYVATCPETGISFYINNGQGGAIGVRVYPNEKKVLENASSVKNEKTYSHGKKEYLFFKDAFGFHKAISASHAVYIAWRNKEIPAGMTIDHIDGVSLNNDFQNLRCISNAQNCRDGGFLSKLRHKGFNPACIERAYLLRYFDRMAEIKATITGYRYDRLTKEQLRSIIFLPDEELQPPLRLPLQSKNPSPALPSRERG